jgi:hypothetical protein
LPWNKSSHLTQQTKIQLYTIAWKLNKNIINNFATFKLCNQSVYYI